MRLLCKLHFVFLAQYYCSEIHEVLHLFHDKFDLDISRNHVWLYASTGIVNDLLHGQLRLREAFDHVDSQDSYSHISYSVCAQSWYHANPESLHGRRQRQTSAQCASCCRSKAVSCHFFHFLIVFRFRKGSPPPPNVAEGEGFPMCLLPGRRGMLQTMASPPSLPPPVLPPELPPWLPPVLPEPPVPVPEPEPEPPVPAGALAWPSTSRL